jgi:FG-GAP-like repeat
MMRMLRRNSLLSFFVPLIAIAIVVMGLALQAQTTGAGQRPAQHAVVSGQLQLVEVPPAPIFAAPVVYGLGGAYGADSVAVADVNGDGYPDLVVANACVSYSACNSDDDGSVSVLLGKGDGTFQAAVTYSSGGITARSVAVADVNGDGKPDLLVANYFWKGSGSGVVGVLLGNGDGTFQTPVTYDTGGYFTFSVAVADLNGDGKPDIAVANFSGTVGVLLGNGDGTFQTAVTYSPGGSGPQSVAVADLDGDGHLDLVVANQNQGSRGAVSVLLGNGDGTLQSPVSYSSGGYWTSSAVIADVNHDGFPDVIVSNICASINPDGTCNSGGELSVLLGKGDGTFRTPVAYYTGDGVENSSVAVADLNGDGKSDIAVLNGFSVSVFLGNGNGTFQSPVSYSNGGRYSISMAVADVNRDGKPDLLVTDACYYSHCLAGSAVGVLLNIRAATITALTSSLNPSLVGKPVTFTATVTPAHGTIPDGELVTFYDGTIPLRSITLKGGTAAFTTSSLYHGQTERNC